MTWQTCSGFQRECLQAIVACTQAEEVPYGLALQARLNERYGESINHSRLYQNLDRLSEAGLVECSAVDDRTNRYDLTPKGERALTAQAARLQQLADALEAPMGTTAGADADSADHEPLRPPRD
jgi:DNA-binding PadR family transcriptional regulator